MKTQPSGGFASAVPTLPTSRTAPAQERNVLSILRAVAPRRRLSLREAELIAELQANRLLELAGLDEPPVPNELITELPRIRVRTDPDLPASGTAHWSSGRWVISINASEPWTRRRYSLAHEAKHVIDHRHFDALYDNAATAEYAADAFAAALLMPKRLVRKQWYAGVQQLSTLSEVFGVSPRAMAIRLERLGLRSTPSRRSPAPRAGKAYYQRVQPLQSSGVMK